MAIMCVLSERSMPGWKGYVSVGKDMPKQIDKRNKWEPAMSLAREDWSCWCRGGGQSSLVECGSERLCFITGMICLCSGVICVLFGNDMFLVRKCYASWSKMVGFCSGMIGFCWEKDIILFKFDMLVLGGDTLCCSEMICFLFGDELSPGRKV